MYIDAPGGAATVSGASVQILGWATDASRIASLAFQLDGASLALNGPYTYGLSRSDVCSAVPTGDANCPNVGWRAYFDSTRFLDGSHTLTVTATDTAGNTFSLQRSFAVSNPPNAPAGLVATVLSATSIRLNWTDASSNETQFEIQRRVAPAGTFGAIATVGANVVTSTDSTASPGTSYEYRVAAKNAIGTSFSNTASAATNQVIPVAATGLTAVYNWPVRQFVLTWVDNSNNEQGFAPQFSYSGSAFSDLNNPVGANVTSYTSGANPPVGSWQFRIRAYNSAGSSYSTAVSLLVINPANGAGYVGCYTDTATRALPVQLAGTNNTIESCKQAAYNAGYKYAGLQYFGYCFAGNTLGFSLVAETECSTACTANSGQICGGVWRNSIYNTGYVPPQPATSIAWIQPAESSWGPAGTLTAAGYATNGTGRVTLVWRERSSTGVWGGWNTVGYTAPVSADTTWSNTISSGSPTKKCNWFDAYTIYSGVISATFHYTGAASCG
jgi:hypothetical protein